MEETLTASLDLMYERLDKWLELLVANIPNIVVAIIAFMIFYGISIVVQRLISRVLKRSMDQPSMRMLILRTVSIIIIGLGFILALGIMNLDTALKSILAGAGVAGLAVGLALQGTLSNTFSGIFLAVKDILNVGDWVETNGFAGTVDKITLRNTFIKEPDNNLVVLPNKLILENPFKNYGLTTQIRVILECGIGYEEDLERVRSVAVDAIEERFHHDMDQPVEFYYTEFGSSSINFMMRFWIDATENLNILEARSESIVTLKKALDKHEINIPFPIRTLDIRKDGKQFIHQIANNHYVKSEN